MRKRMSRGKSRRNFTKGTRVKRANSRRAPRGGYRF